MQAQESFRVLKVTIIVDRLARQSESSGRVRQGFSTMRKSSKIWQTKEHHAERKINDPRDRAGQILARFTVFQMTGEVEQGIRKKETFWTKCRTLVYEEWSNITTDRNATYKLTNMTLELFSLRNGQFQRNSEKRQMNTTF